MKFSLTNKFKDRLREEILNFNIDFIQKSFEGVSYVDITELLYEFDSNDNIILEEDFNLNNKLPNPPEISCYLGGWIVSLKMKDINKKIKINNLKNGINNINYENFRILTTHAYYIKNVNEATLLLIDILTKNKIKNYDIYLSDNKIINNYYYPEIFIQSKHKSEIDGKTNKNHKNTLNYGL